MSRPGRRAPLSIVIAALAALALPVAAHAANYTIQTGGGACSADLVCGSFSDAADVAANGDTFAVKAGNYTGGDTFSVAVTFNGEPGATLNGTLTFTNTAGLTTLKAVNVVQTGNAPAIVASGSGGVAISDLLAGSALSNGVEFTAPLLGTNTNNTITRSNIISAGNAMSAVRVLANAGGTASVSLFSSFAAGGLRGIGVFSSGGTASATARHVTATGGANGTYLDAALTGSATITVRDSIDLSPGNNPALGGMETPDIDAATLQTGDRNVLFADPSRGNYRLRPGSPALGAGGAPTGGESTTDIDGQDRSAAPTDLGADEYVNTAPKAVIAASTKTPRDGQAITLDGSGSTDQPGGGIASYKWDFGDGTTLTTATAAVVHTYKGEGAVKPKLTVVDGEGASSTPVTVDLTVLDGGAPAVVISKPKNKQRFKQFTTKTKTVTKNGVKKKVKTRKRTQIKFAGTATDKSGVARVLLTVEKTANAKKTTVAQGRATSKKCRWLDPKKGLKRKSCDTPITILVKLKDDGSWAYNVRKSIHLSKGSYRAIVYGFDKTGFFGNAAAKADRNIKFTIR